MYRYLILVAALAAVVVMLSGDAQAARRGRCRGGYVVPSAPVATAQAGGGYRTYSYEPGTAVYAPRPARTSAGKAPYLDARSKALGGRVP